MHRATLITLCVAVVAPASTLAQEAAEAQATAMVRAAVDAPDAPPLDHGNLGAAARGAPRHERAWFGGVAPAVAGGLLIATYRLGDFGCDFGVGSCSMTTSEGLWATTVVGTLIIVTGLVLVAVGVVRWIEVDAQLAARSRRHERRHWTLRLDRAGLAVAF